MAISDVLADAVTKINDYLDDSFGGYEGNLRLRIQALVAMMDAIRAELDTPPTAEEVAVHDIQEAKAHLAALGKALGFLEGK